VRRRCYNDRGAVVLQRFRKEEGDRGHEIVVAFIDTDDMLVCVLPDSSAHSAT
jgi:hypothetical protein